MDATCSSCTAPSRPARSPAWLALPLFWFPGPDLLTRGLARRSKYLDPGSLSTLVKVGYNQKAFKPPIKSIKEKYYALFRGKKGADDAADDRRLQRALQGPHASGA